ncbi:MAG: hypothetical protein RL070_1466 [Bacteroidota bacterium]|jgi:hypothetical protein
MNTIKQVIQEVNSIGFWKVIFRWSSIKNWLLTMFLELQKTIEMAEKEHLDLDAANKNLVQLRSEKSAIENRVNDLLQDKAAQNTELSILRNQIRQLETENSQLKSTDEQRYIDHQKSIETLTVFQNGIIKEKEMIKSEQQRQAVARLENQKQTWQRHQQDVENKMRLLCEKHTIEYVDTVPFKGDPDNTVVISNLFQVFDSKSPRGEDLSNFTTYLNKEAQNAKKYAEKKDVRSDIFFVVPSNTLEILTQTVFVFEKHCVYVIPAEALEPVLISLKKIEDYEFMGQFTPEDRENICRIIGRLVHNIKRRVQIDISLGKETMSLASDCEKLLPEEIAKEVLLIERAIKVNPTREMKGKEIPLEDLKEDLLKVEKDSERMGTVAAPGSVITISLKPEEMSMLKEAVG